MYVCVWGGGGTLIFSYILRLRPFFFLFKILNFIIFVFRKMHIFGDMNILWIFLGHHKIGQYLGVISMHIRVFS